MKGASLFRGFAVFFVSVGVRSWFQLVYTGLEPLTHTNEHESSRISNIQTHEL